MVIFPDCAGAMDLWRGLSLYILAVRTFGGNSGLARPFCLLALLYACSLILELVQLLVLFMYSDRIRHDLALSVVIPLYPLYQIFIKAVDLVVLSGEILVRDSGRDDFVPERYVPPRGSSSSRVLPACT